MIGKQCGNCKEMLPLYDFWRRTASADGLQHWCKRCMRAYMLEHPHDHRKAPKRTDTDGRQYELFPDARGKRYHVRFNVHNRNEVLNVLSLLRQMKIIGKVELL